MYEQLTSRFSQSMAALPSSPEHSDPPVFPINSHFKHNISLRTTRLHIRPIAPTDEPSIYEIRSFPKVYQWAIAGKWHSLSQASDWINNNLTDPMKANFVIELLSNPIPSTPSSSAAPQPFPGRIIGAIGIHKPPEIGFMFHPHFWGKGYATEALSAFLTAFFEHLPYGHAEALTDPENEACRRLLERCRFKLVSVDE